MIPFVRGVMLFSSISGLMHQVSGETSTNGARRLSSVVAIGLSMGFLLALTRRRSHGEAA